MDPQYFEGFVNMNNVTGAYVVAGRCAKEALHRKPKAKTIQLLEIETLSAMPKPTVVVPTTRRYKQLRLNFRPKK